MAKALPTDPEWLKIAFAEVGVRETPGKAASKSNRRIDAYLKTVGLSNDDTPWCSAFVNWVFAQLGVKGTGSGLARSWQKWGMRLQEPRRGCIVVFWRGQRNGSKGHVGFYLGKKGTRIQVLGGNQSDAVTDDNLYGSDRVLAYVWPIGAAAAASTANVNRAGFQPLMLALYVSALAGMLYKVRNVKTTTDLS